MLYVLLYMLVIFGFSAWDAFIGMPVNWDPNFDNAPPRWLAALFWPIAVPVVSIIAFAEFLENAKEKRIKREKEKNRLRIKLQKEEEQLLKEVEEEIFNERKNSNRS